MNFKKGNFGSNLEYIDDDGNDQKAKCYSIYGTMAKSKEDISVKCRFRYIPEHIIKLFIENEKIEFKNATIRKTAYGILILNLCKSISRIFCP